MPRLLRSRLVLVAAVTVLLPMRCWSEDPPGIRIENAFTAALQEQRAQQALQQRLYAVQEGQSGAFGEAAGAFGEPPSIEVCDCKDNDGNGIPDDGAWGRLCCNGDELRTVVCQSTTIPGVSFVPGGQPADIQICRLSCSGPLPSDPDDLQCGSAVGECVPGLRYCRDGSLKCRDQVSATPEVCDGLDNDCDGDVDNGNPGGGSPCGSNEGACEEGIGRCEHGRILCDDIGPTPELCDGVDNDCDGDVDNDCTPTLSLIHPDHGYRADTILLEGERFSGIPGENQVTFNGVAATQVSIVSQERLRVVIPNTFSPGTYSVVVAVLGAQSNALSLEVHDGTRSFSGLIDAGAAVGRTVDLAIDAKDRPVIAYVDEDAGSLMAAAWDGFSWQISEVYGGQVYSGDISIAIAGTRPHVTYLSTSGLQHSTRTNAGWVAETIGGGVPFHDLQIDRQGGLHVCHSELATVGSLVDLMYSFKPAPGASWSRELVAPDGGACSIGLTTAGEPQIVFTETNLTGHGTQVGPTWRFVLWTERTGAGWSQPSSTSTATDWATPVEFIVDEHNSPIVVPRIPHAFLPIVSNGIVMTERVFGSWGSGRLVVGDTWGTDLRDRPQAHPVVSFYEEFGRDDVRVRYVDATRFGPTVHDVGQARAPAQRNAQTAVDVDSRGNLHFAYWGGTDVHGLQYVTQTD